MEKKSLIFYKANYVDIDPNVEYNEEDFDKKKYFIIDKRSSQHYSNAAIDMFATLVNINAKVYDLERIRGIFKLKGILTIVSDTKYSITFVDIAGNTAVIEKKKLNFYLKNRVSDYYVLQREDIADIGDGTVVDEYLINSILLNQGCTVERGGHYLLTEEQIRQIDKMVFGLNLMQHYEKQNPRIFVYFKEFKP